MLTIAGWCGARRRREESPAPTDARNQLLITSGGGRRERESTVKSSLPERPVIKSRSGVVQARHYNALRLAQFRLGAPLEEVLGVRGLEFYIDRTAWVCFDRQLECQPLLAWTDFAPSLRSALHEPVPCRVLYYHAFASIVIATVLDDLGRKLAARLRVQARGLGRGAVLALPPRTRP
jgi:hypothetical protein